MSTHYCDPTGARIARTQRTLSHKHSPSPRSGDEQCWRGDVYTAPTTTTTTTTTKADGDGSDACPLPAARTPSVILKVGGGTSLQQSATSAADDGNTSEATASDGTNGGSDGGGGGGGAGDSVSAPASRVLMADVIVWTTVAAGAALLALVVCVSSRRRRVAISRRCARAHAAASAAWRDGWRWLAQMPAAVPRPPPRRVAPHAKQPSGRQSSTEGVPPYRLDSTRRAWP